MGSPSFRQVRTPTVEVVSAWFPPNARLASHTHAKAVFGVMVGGAFRTRIVRAEVDYVAASAWTEPAEERHANVAGAEGARVVIVQPGSSEVDLADECRRLLGGVICFRSADLLAEACRLEAECALPDDLSPLVIEGTALAMLARGARLYRRRAHHEAGPRWLKLAVDYLHEHRLDRINLGELAVSLGVHPSRLAHEFRTRLGTTPGDYVRRLRLDWAADRLRGSNATIAEIAVRAGFYDQSHFSRTFRRHFGVAPADWRRSRMT